MWEEPQDVSRIPLGSLPTTCLQDVRYPRCLQSRPVGLGRVAAQEELGRNGAEPL